VAGGGSASVSRLRWKGLQTELELSFKNTGDEQMMDHLFSLITMWSISSPAPVLCNQPHEEMAFVCCP